MWCSKYALTEGVFEFEPTSINETYAWKDGWSMLKLGRDAWERKEDAIADAEKRRVRKIASVRKQLAKLEKMNFGVI